MLVVKVSGYKTKNSIGFPKASIQLASPSEIFDYQYFNISLLIYFSQLLFCHLFAKTLFHKEFFTLISVYNAARAITHPANVVRVISSPTVAVRAIIFHANAVREMTSPVMQYG